MQHKTIHTKIVAARGESYNNANSPKHPPRLYSPTFTPSTNMSNAPCSVT